MFVGIDGLGESSVPRSIVASGSFWLEWLPQPGDGLLKVRGKAQAQGRRELRGASLEDVKKEERCFERSC